MNSFFTAPSYSQSSQICHQCFAKLCFFSDLRPSFYADIANWKEERSRSLLLTAAHTGLAETRFTEIVLLEHAQDDALYGPNVLRMMGKAAFVCASRHARCAVVLAKADSIEFRRTIGAGEIVDVRARLAFRGHSSMTVLVDVDPADCGGDMPAVSGRFMMVAVDRDGVPMPIPSFADQSCREETAS
jgi:acyl-CoA hydrolase